MNTAVIACEGLDKRFDEGPAPVSVLTGVNFAVAPGEQVAIVGASGSGKSTLLHLLGGLDMPTAGVVRVAGEDISRLSDAGRGLLRNAALGFVYQFHHLLAEFSALENVAMPLLIRRTGVADARRRAEECLDKVGLAQRIHHKPGELSGGERQRAAIARALVTKPLCVMADEPTGNLDRKNADNVFALMRELNRDAGTALVMVTHDPELARRMGRIMRLEDGQLR